MNTLQAQKKAKLDRLLSKLQLTPANRALAEEYLTAEQRDDSLLQRAEEEDFHEVSWEVRGEAVDYANDLRSWDNPDPLARLIKLYWAMGKSTAVFLLERSSDSKTGREELKLRTELLGKPAAVALEAERVVWYEPGYRDLEWFYALAASEPEILEQAQALAGGHRDNYKVMLAGILVAVQQGNKLSLFQKLVGAKQPLVARQIQLIHRNNLETMAAALPKLSDKDRQALAEYLEKGDLNAPKPALSAAWANAANPSAALAARGAETYLAGLLGTASFLGAEQDPRLRCALRMYLGLNPAAVLQNILRGVSQHVMLDQKDRLNHLLEDLPGGDVTMLIFLTMLPTWDGRNSFYKVVARQCRNGLKQALDLADAQQYVRLTDMMPGAGAVDRDQRNKINTLLSKYIQNGASAMTQYLEGTGSLKDSAVRLAGVTVQPYVYPSQAAQLVERYVKAAGWDEFACRCATVFGLVFEGSGMNHLLHSDQDVARLAAALQEQELPLGEILRIFGYFCDGCYDERRKTTTRNTLYKNFSKPVYLEDLCAAALNSGVFGRYVALSALDDLTASPECGSRAKEGLLAGAGDSSKQIQELMVDLLTSHPDWTGEVTGLLRSKKAAERLIAVRAAAKMGEAIHPALEEALEKEKSAKVADAIRGALGQASAPAEQAAALTIDEKAAQILKGGKKRKVQWVLDHPLPELHLQDEARTPVSEDRRAALLVAYSELGRIGRSETAALLAEGIDPADLAALAGEVYEIWLAAGAQSKTKWVLAFAAAFGGAAMTPRLNHAINEWPQQSRGAIACDAVTALALSSDPAALLVVDSISRKFKFRQVKAAAAAALDNAARELGITAEELADRIVPDLGFRADGKRVFDYGPRSFTVRLTPTLELEITNDAGKTVKNLPAPGKTDDPEKAEAAYNEFKTMKKQIRTTVTAQKARLEAALSVLRCWSSDAWKALFVGNPIMHQFAMSLIWGVYQDGTLQETFRYMEDGSFNTVDEEEYTLPDDARIGLAHPVEMDQETLDAWKQQLEDYEITQSIPQLDRPVFQLEPGQEQARTLDRFGGKKLNGLSLSGKLLGLGWYRGSVQDAGGYYTFYREDPGLGMGVELEFSGCFVGDENETVTVYEATFYRQGTVQRGSYCYDTPKPENIFALGEVPARYYSEVVYQLDKATVSSTETDPDWRKKNR